MAEKAVKLEHREMGDKPIAQTFQGILRVAGLQELDPATEDVFLDSKYYGNLVGGISSQAFYYDSASIALSGGLERYKSDDPYKANKVPVTDSLGYYLNINFGSESTTIGKDEGNNGNNADKTTFYQIFSPNEVQQDVVFPVFETKDVVIGLEPIKESEYKSVIKTGTLEIDSSDTSASFITYNNYDHTEKNIKDGMYQKVNGIQNRTIIRDTSNSVNDFDVLMHRQDNIDFHNLITNNTLDAFVEPTSLKDFIKERIGVFGQDNIDEVLTGTIVQQYVDLNKWYCSSDSSTGYSGHQPPLNRPDYNEELVPCIYQNASAGGNKISSNLSLEESDKKAWDQRQLEEIVPLYKRDYLLCDGSTYYIYLSTVNGVNNINYISFDRFFNLFFCIEYRYTDRDKIKKHYVNAPQTLSDRTVKYQYLLTDNKKTENQEEIDKEVLFGVDVVSALAFKAIWNNMLYGKDNNGKPACLNPTTNQYDRNLAEEWLKNQKIPDEYIFNTPIPTEQGGITYTYTTAPDKNGTGSVEIPFQLGKEVNSFSSDLWYYSCKDKKYLPVQVWRTAEVQSVLDLFSLFGVARERELNQNYVFSFQVPNVKIDSSKYSVGAAIGSSPYYWSDDINGVNKTESICSFDDGMIPHRHYFLEGAATDNKLSGSTSTVTTTSMARGEGPWLVGTQFDGNRWSIGHDHNDRFYNYLFCELENTSYEWSFMSGLSVKRIQLKNLTKETDPDPRFVDAEPDRGRTSTPIVISTQPTNKYTQASANSLIGSAEFFSPETIQVMTLIKL